MTPSEILLVSYGFEMERIDTRSVATEMIQFQTLSYLSHEQFVNHAVGGYFSALDSHAAITAPVQAPGPDPTPICL